MIIQNRLYAVRFNSSFREKILFSILLVEEINIFFFGPFPADRYHVFS